MEGEMQADSPTGAGISTGISSTLEAVTVELWAQLGRECGNVLGGDSTCSFSYENPQWHRETDYGLGRYHWPNKSGLFL